MHDTPDAAAASATRVPTVRTLAGEEGYLPLLAGAPQTCGMRSGRVRLQPNEHCGRHSTGAHEETLVVLAGAGWVEIDGRRALEVTAPAAVYIPPQTEHDVVAGAGSALVYVYVVAPIHGRTQ